jgi:uncharacterized protein (DUF1919 family)
MVVAPMAKHDPNITHACTLRRFSCVARTQNAPFINAFNLFNESTRFPRSAVIYLDAKVHVVQARKENTYANKYYMEGHG